ncbi:MAG: hypothetical protein M3Y87_21085 [Myxococcota bacterium]|nr:hypothetical protein [Myxococcota bacterium]
MKHVVWVLGCIAVASGCAVPSASPECEASWEVSVDEGELCEQDVVVASEAALTDGHVVRRPRDSASGQASGKRTHHPVTF